MAAITLGSQVQGLQVILPRNGDFYATLQNADGDWDPATVIELRFNDGDDTVWTATIDGDEAQFAEDKVAVTAVIAAGATSAVLFYTLGTVELPWAHGAVNVQG